MNTVPNRQVICDVLCRQAENDRNIVVLCSDSRGSSLVVPFIERFPEQFVEVGIAEQNLVSISAGLARCGKRPFAASPASFLSSRSVEQIKVDVAYSHTNVKLIGISGGVSYGALGMTHHAAQDIAMVSAIPNMRVYIPSDRFQTEKLFETLVIDNEPAYIRVGRSPAEDVYSADDIQFEMDKASKVRDGSDITIIACGEMVAPAVHAADALKDCGIDARVLDMYCIKPIDRDAVLCAAKETKAILTVEEHSPFGGLGSMVAQIVGDSGCRVPVKNMALPDAPVITGDPKEVLRYHGLDADGIAKTAREMAAGV